MIAQTLEPPYRTAQKAVGASDCTLWLISGARHGAASQEFGIASLEFRR